MSSTDHQSKAPSWRSEITKVQWLVLAGTTLGWGLDGFAGSLYILTLGPAMNDVLPHSGIAVTPSAIGFYGGLTVAFFLAGWATGGIVFGVLADLVGRTRILSLGIATYALFTALTALADTWSQVAVLRFLAGLGSGVEAPVGAALVAETWRNRYRARAGGVMMSGYAGGFFIASSTYALVGHHGWRPMLALAVIPALVVLFIRRFVPEPPEVEAQVRARGAVTVRRSLLAVSSTLRQLLTPPLRRPTLICTALATGSLVSFWSVSTWYPQIVREMSASEETWSAADHRVAVASMLFNAGGILGYAAWGFLADALGRRGAFLLSFVIAGVAIVYAFPVEHQYATFVVAMPFLGFGLFGALSGTFIYGPEIFPTSVRATGMALSNSVGRFLTAAGPLVAGIVATTVFAGDLGSATASVAAIGIVALIGLAFAPETKGCDLPSDAFAQPSSELVEVRPPSFLPRQTSEEPR